MASPLFLNLGAAERTRAVLTDNLPRAEREQGLSQADGFLRRALAATVKDPAFVTEAARAKMKVTPVTGEELTQRMSELIATPPEVIQKTSTLIGGSPL